MFGLKDIGNGINTVANMNGVKVIGQEDKKTMIGKKADGKGFRSVGIMYRADGQRGDIKKKALQYNHLKRLFIILVFK
jgi:hypothetical protein